MLLNVLWRPRQEKEKRQAVKREAEGDNGEGNKEGDDLHGNS